MDAAGNHRQRQRGLNLWQPLPAASSSGPELPPQNDTTTMPGLPLSESVESYLSRPQIPAAQEDLTFYDPDARSFYGDDDQDQPPAETMDSNRHSLATDQALRYLGLDEYYEQLSSPASGTSHETDRRLSTEFTLESTRAELRKTNTERQQNAIPFDRIPLSSNTITTHTTESLRPRRQQQNQMLFDRIPLAAHSLIPAGPERNYNQPLSERDEIAERAQRLRPARPAHTASDPYGDIYYTPPEQAQQVSRCVMTEQIRELRRRNDMAVLGATRPGNSSRDNMVASSSARSSAQSRHCADGSSSCSWHDTPARSGPPREIDMGYRFPDPERQSYNDSASSAATVWPRYIDRRQVFASPVENVVSRRQMAHNREASVFARARREPYERGGLSINTQSRDRGKGKVKEPTASNEPQERIQTRIPYEGVPRLRRDCQESEAISKPHRAADSELHRQETRSDGMRRQRTHDSEASFSSQRTVVPNSSRPNTGVSGLSRQATTRPTRPDHETDESFVVGPALPSVEAAAANADPADAGAPARFYPQGILAPIEAVQTEARRAGGNIFKRAWHKVKVAVKYKFFKMDE